MVEIDESVDAVYEFDIMSNLSDLEKAVTGFIEVIRRLRSAEMCKCSTNAIKNAFKWAEYINNTGKLFDRGTIGRVCTQLAHNRIEISDPSLLVIDPVQVIVQATLESPMLAMSSEGASVAQECIRCACSVLGPEQTVRLISSVLAPLIQTRSTIETFHLDHSSDYVMNKIFAAELIKCIHGNADCSYPARSSVSDIRADLIQLPTTDAAALKVVLVSMELTVRDLLQISSGEISEAEALNSLQHAQRELAAVISESFRSNTFFTLDHAGIECSVRLCRKNANICQSLEDGLVSVGQRLIRLIAEDKDAGKRFAICRYCAKDNFTCLYFTNRL